jgi:septum site-determining protein MinD
MGRAIVITSGKGGVGKSTTTANIGTALALAGHQVVLIDADVGLRSLDLIMGLEGRVVNTSFDVINGRCELEQAMVRDRRSKNLKLLAAPQDRNKNEISPAQMKEIGAMLKLTYDYILIDSPAGIEQGFQNAVAGADEAIIVVTPEIPAIRDADRVVGLLREKGIEPRLIVNRLFLQMVQAYDMLDHQDVVDLLGVKLLGVIPEDARRTIASSNRGEPLTCNPHTPVGAAYRRIAQRIEGKNVPIPEFKDANWFGNLLSKLFS